MVVETRVLGVAESAMGMGFVVLEGPRRLIDWGTRTLGRGKRGVHLARVRDLVRRYEPDVIVIESDEDTPGRGDNVRERIRDLVSYARAMGIAVVRIERRAFWTRESSSMSRYEVSLTVVSHFPELLLSLPRDRMPWMSIDLRSHMFAACGLCLAYYAQV